MKLLLDQISDAELLLMLHSLQAQIIALQGQSTLSQAQPLQANLRFPYQIKSVRIPVACGGSLINAT